MSKANELAFLNDLIRQLQAGCWLLGQAEKYNRELTLYPEGLLGFVQETQDEQWQKFCKLYPGNAEQKFQEQLVGLLERSESGQKHWRASACVMIKDKT